MDLSSSIYGLAVMSMKLKQVAMAGLVVGSALTWLALPASANTETISEAFGSSSSPWAIGGSDFPALLTLPKFDASLGNLTDIEIYLSAIGILQSDVYNLGVATDFINAQATGIITATGPDGTESLVTLATAPFNGSIGSGAFVQGPDVSLSGTGASHVALSDFREYEENGIGGGLDFSLDATLNSSGNGPPGLFFGGDAGVYGALEVVYTYAPVPEPRSLFPELSLLGVCGFAGFDRMRRYRSCRWRSHE